MRHALACALLMLSTLAQAQSNFALDANPGSYAVGLRVLPQYDAARPYQRKAAARGAAAVASEQGRPLLTLVWYPAGKEGNGNVAGGARLSSADYVRITRADEQFALPAEEAERRVAAWVKARSAAMPQAAVLQEMQQPTLALRDVAPATGVFPLVVYAPGFGSSAAENAELCEFLASHGYVVMASASMGSRGRTMSLDIEGVEAQAADIRFLIGAARQLPQGGSGGSHLSN